MFQRLQPNRPHVAPRQLGLAPRANPPSATASCATASRVESSRPGYWFFIHYLAKRTDEANEGNVDSALDGDLPNDEASKLRRLEATIFLAREGLTSRKLAKLAGLADATEARTLIRRLNELYDEQHRAFKIEEVAGGYGLLTRPQFASWLRRLAHVPNEKRLGQATMETLAIVAYRQPVLRADVEAIRGVGCSETLRQLMELDLVRISGRSEDLGRPYLYATTRRFLQMFGLRSADRLPRRAWVNESQMALTSSDIAGSDSGVKESSVTKSFSAASLLEAPQGEELEENPGQITASSDDDDAFYEEDFDDGEDDFDDDDDEEEGDDWDDDDDDEEDDLEEQSEWQEVDDDDDGWEDSDDDDEDDDEEDDWGDEEDEDEDWD